MEKEVLDFLKDAVDSSDYVRMKVASYSMVPQLLPGSEIIVKRVAFNEINPGDIIVFESKNNMVVHRIIFKIWKWVITRGIANRFFDKPVKFDKIIGKVVLIDRYD